MYENIRAISWISDVIVEKGKLLTNAFKVLNPHFLITLLHLTENSCKKPVLVALHFRDVEYFNDHNYQYSKFICMYNLW